MSKTRIVCTIGPASDKEEILVQMIQKGMNVARFNFSHGTHEEQQIRFERVDKIRKELDVPLAMMMDTKGPEIRFRDFADGHVNVADGQKFTLTTQEIIGTENIGAISYKDLYKDVSVGTTILVNDGIIEMTVESIEELPDQEKKINCIVVHGGKISNHKALNVPSAHLSMEYLSETDKSDLEFAAKMNYEFVAASFVREADNIKEMRKYLAAFNYYPKIISKIENQEGIDNLEEIIKESDGIMVARGDMGVEISFEEVPEIQKSMITKTLEEGKIVITATNMLESMCENPRPTRAEVNDVANAVYDGSTAVMLSGESAAGKYPVEAVSTMQRIIKRAEESDRCLKTLPKREESGQILANAAVEIADKLNADAIIALTLSGSTATKISLNKSKTKVIACCTEKRVANQLCLSYGVDCVMVDILKNEDVFIDEVIESCKEKNKICTGDTVVFVAGLPLEVSGITNMIRVITVK